MAMAFAENATLNGASGRLAKGRGEIERLLEEEQATVMKATRFTWIVNSITFLPPNSAMLEGESVISGLTGADGKPVSTTRFGIAAVLTKKDNAWAIGPCMFIPLPARGAASPPLAVPARN